ncbi:Ger(x)C family spore germination protein [Lysinibacillus sp. CD3-6]|uniref:Ger(x)C family spore germination protein n=1 Tax=Lysinibacillus sp. CD3-6 TaxID=2892541 RepID=UPI00116DC6C7|nr:Ger(x)C family spore germination protein [Lysinibacillus sp. CD3-6]UED82466.1 Ger(x)C family spore germination protein [Lysinibacillus sp. CD3-6]
MSKIKMILLLLILTLLLSGCWSKRELNELAIVVALGIDKIDDEYEISIQVVDPSEISSKQPSSGRSPVVTYHAKGKSVFEAIRRMTTLTPRKPYFSHLQIVVIGQKLAEEGLNEPLDFIARDHEFRNDFDVVMSYQTTAKEVLNVLTPIEKMPANKLLNSIKVSEKSWGSTLTVNTDELLNTLSSKEKSAVLSAVEIEGDPKLGIDQTNVERIKTPVILKYSGIAVFKEDKLLGLLSEEESIYFNFLNNKIESTVVVLACPDKGDLTTEITQSKAKIKGIFEKGTPKISIKINVTQNIGEVNCAINLTQNKTIEYIDKLTEDQIKEQTEKTLNIIQKSYKLDILGFGEALRRENPKKWKEMQKEWSTIYPEITVDIDVTVNTQGLGTIQNSLLYKSKE